MVNICFCTDHCVQSGHSVELKIQIGEDKPFSLLAKVIWSNPIAGSGDYNTGVQIMNVNSQDAKKFKEFYQSQLKYPPND